MKKIFIVFLLLFVCGCTSNYTLEINNDSFKEDININILNSEIPKGDYGDIELDDPITPFLNNKTSASITNKKSFYKKKVNYYDNYIEVNMKKSYNEKEFYNSSSLNLCFQNYQFDYKDNYYIHAYGNFYCLYSEELDINIKTNNKVVKNNADSVNGNIYTWHINTNNKSNVNIEFEVEKGFPLKQFIVYGTIAIILLGIVSVAVYFLYYKRKKTNEI